MASGKTLQSTIEISGVLSPSLQAAINSAVDRLADMSKETLDSADAASRLVAEMSEQEDILKTLKKAYAGYAVEGKESSEEAQDLAKKIQDVSDELKQNKKQLDAAERAADSFGESLEDAGEKAEKSSDGYTVMKDVIADLATDAIRNAVDSFKELAIEGDKAFSMLEAKTGASAKKMEGYEDVIKDIYKDTYGESLTDVSDKLAIVIQMTDDLDNASLTKVTKNAIALEKVYGFDVSESMRSVNSLMDQFGITSDEAFNLIVQGAQQGLNQNGDLMDVINEYAVQFKGAGYSADDMFNMLANGAATGTWSVDKLGDAVKEFNIRMSDGTANDYLEQLGVDADAVVAKFNKGGPEAQEAINTVMKAIMGCDDATLQYQAGVGIFGTMWEDLGADTVSSLMQTEGAINSANNAMETMDTAAYDTLSAKLEGVGRQYKGVGSAVAGTASAATLAAMNLDTITTKFSMAKTTFASAGKSMGQALASIPPHAWLVVAAVLDIVAVFASLWTRNEEFRESVIGIWEDIKSKFEEFGKAITDRLNALGIDFENFGEVALAIWDGICNLFAPIFEHQFKQITNVLAAVLDIIIGIFDIFAGIFTGDWDMVWQGVTEIFSAIWEFIVATFMNALNLLKGYADIVLGWFGTSWDEVWGGIKTFFVDTWTSIATFFSGIWTSITTFCSNAWQTIKNVITVGIMLIGSIIRAAFQIITLPFRFIWENCKDTIIAAWNVIKEKVTTALNAIKGVISTVWNAIKGVIVPIITAIVNFVKQRWENLKNNVLTVFNTVKSIASTAWNAIKTSISNVVNGIRNTVSSIFDSIKTKVSNVFNGIKSIASSVWGSIKSAITTPINAARDAVKAAIDKIKSFFNFSWSLPKLKLPHFSIDGEFSINPPSVPEFKVSWYKDGGILTQPTVFGAAGNTLLAGGEAGDEAVVPLAVLWDKLETMIRSVFNSASSTGGTTDEGLTATAGKLLTLDDFSLGSLADGTSVVIYYDFSGFTWSPQIQTNGSSNDEDDLMARLKAHEAEFFDWLEEFIKMREVAQYA